MKTTNIINIQNLCKSFAEHDALKSINIDIRNGEFLTLLGPSGCGKTTLLRILAGFETADSGSIRLNGENLISIPAEKRHINMVFQSYALFPHMNVYENIAFGLRCKKLPTTEIKTRVHDALTRVNLQNFAKRKPDSLSGGQQQRVAIARAIVNEPQVLLLDEPLSALDYNLRKLMRLELKELQQRLGITFIFVTHDQEEALTMSDRIAVMNAGKIEQIGTSRDIYEEPSNLFTAKFIGEANIFETVVEEVFDNQILARIEGQKFTLKNTDNFTKNQKIAVIIRPEDISVWDQFEITGKTGLLPGVVEQVIYKGSTVDLMLRLESGKKIAASAFFDEDDENLDYHNRDKIWMQWNLGWEVILADGE